MMLRYSAKIPTVIFQKAWGKIFDKLSDEDAGRLIKAIFLFMNGESPLFEDNYLDVMYSLITEQIEHSARKYYNRVAVDTDEYDLD